MQRSTTLARLAGTAMLLTGCITVQLPPAPATPAATGAVITLAAPTANLPTPTSAPASATPSPAPSNTTVPAPTPTPAPATPAPTKTIPAPSATPRPQACANAAQFVADVTVPDGSRLSENAQFIKTWRVRNTGTCAWDRRYSLVFDSGTILTEAGAQSISIGEIGPGAIGDISALMRAPIYPGDYRSAWRFRAPDGTLFGPRLTIVLTAGQPDPNASAAAFIAEIKSHLSARNFAQLASRIADPVVLGDWRPSGGQVPAADAIAALRALIPVTGALQFGEAPDLLTAGSVVGPHEGRFLLRGLGADRMSQAIVYVGRDERGLMSMRGLLTNAGHGPSPEEELAMFTGHLKAWLNERDYAALAGTMSDPFIVAVWGSESGPESRERALEMLKGWLQNGFQLAYDLPVPADINEAVMGQAIASRFSLRGLGRTGRGEAVVYLTHDAKGGLQWRGLVLALGGFN